MHCSPSHLSQLSLHCSIEMLCPEHLEIQEQEAASPLQEDKGMVGRGQDAQYCFYVPHSHHHNILSTVCSLGPTTRPHQRIPTPLQSQRQSSDSHLPEGKPWDFSVIFLHWPIKGGPGQFYLLWRNFCIHVQQVSCSSTWVSLEKRQDCLL